MHSCCSDLADNDLSGQLPASFANLDLEANTGGFASLCVLNYVGEGTMYPFEVVNKTPAI